MPRLIRNRTADRETLTLCGDDYEVTIEIGASGLELDAATLERMLHCAVAPLAELFRVGRTVENRETI